MLKISLAVALATGVLGTLATSTAKAGYTQGFEFATTGDFTNSIIQNPNPNVNWALKNNSDSVNSNGAWNVAGLAAPLGFNAQSGSPGSYAYVGADSTLAFTSSTTISNWFMTPTLQFGVNDTVSFWTRTAGTISSSTTPSIYPDRLQVLLSTSGSSVNVGTTASSVGVFTQALGDINPSYVTTTVTSTGPDGYPITWTQYTYAIPQNNFQGRIGFRYLIQDTSIRGNAIGLDTFSTTANLVPEPSSFALMGLGLAALAYRRLKGRKSA
ncbi:MAG: choice-of-anchor J domain-containing protein [bacterium]